MSLAVCGSPDRTFQRRYSSGSPTGYLVRSATKGGLSMLSGSKLLLLLVIALSALTAVAQTSTSRITGRVVDAKQASVRVARQLLAALDQRAVE